MMSFLAAFTLVAVCSASMGDAAAPTGAQEEEDLTVLCFGDSNTWGFVPGSLGDRFPASKRWPTMLGRILAARDDRIRVVADGLNARTSVFEDPVGPCFSTYSCNGRPSLSVALHVHKPLAVVVIALGTNDLKGYLGTTPQTICNGVMVLVNDVKRAVGCGIRAWGQESVPQVLVVTPPALFETPACLIWGFEDCAAKSQALEKLLGAACETLGVQVVHGREMAQVDILDGIHFGEDAQHGIAEGISTKVLDMLKADIKPQSSN